MKRRARLITEFKRKLNGNVKAHREILDNPVIYTIKSTLYKYPIWPR